MAGVENRVAIVTGAGAGLGRSHALGLARGGAKVVVSDISEAAAQAVAEEIAGLGGDAIGVAADVGNPEHVERMAEQALSRWGRIEILVNNAGVLRDRSFVKMELADFELVMKVHLTGSFNCSKAVWETMRAQKFGRIVFTSSASGIYGNFGQANYGAAKAAMLGLMNVLHLEGAKYDIRVNTLAPTAATAMTAGLIPDDAAKLLAPETVTPAVLYLVSDDAPSRMIMGAGAGVFAVTHIAESEGIYLPTDVRTPEEIARRIGEIADRKGERELANAFDQTAKFVTMAQQAEG